MESFNLNIIPGKDRPVCHASQYDIGRTIHVNLFEGFNVFTLDGTEVISISVRKPDGNVVTESVTNTSDSYVEFVTTEQMTACHGSNLCELKLEKGADVIGTMNFILDVEQDPLDGGVQSDTNIHNLQTQVADLVAIEVADQYDSANVIFDAAPVPGHGNGYTVTSEGIATELALKQDATDANLQTTDTTVVGAINELNSGKQDATDSNLQTTDQTVVGAINELNDLNTMGPETPISTVAPFAEYRVCGHLLFVQINTWDHAITSDETLGYIPNTISILMQGRQYTSTGLIAIDKADGKIWARNLATYSAFLFVLPIA